MVRPTALFTVACFFLRSLNNAAVNAVSLPPGTGKYSVGTIELQLTDFSRADPFATNTSSEAGGPRRSIVAQLFYPATNTKKYPLAPYMGLLTASVYEQFYNLSSGAIYGMQTNSHTGAPIRSCDAIHAILFSPGYGVPRRFYTTYAEDLASHGYLVVTLDHPHDASVVEFPDGTIAYTDVTVNMDDPATALKMLDIRVKDTIFTMNQLRGNLTKAIPGVRTRLRITETGMFGHSFGGATAAEVMRVDSRIRGGLDLDGTIFGTVADKGLGRPFALMGVPDHNLSSDLTWISFWGMLRGWKKAMVLAGAQHFTYTDYPALVSVLGLESIFKPEEIASVVGTIDPARANELLRVYIRSFFDFVLGEGSDEIFKVDPQYPEISFQT